MFAFCAFCCDIFCRFLLIVQIYLMYQSERTGSPFLDGVCTYLSWLFYTQFFVVCSAVFVHYVAPQAIGWLIDRIAILKQFEFDYLMLFVSPISHSKILSSWEWFFTGASRFCPFWICIPYFFLADFYGPKGRENRIFLWSQTAAFTRVARNQNSRFLNRYPRIFTL